MDEYVLISGCDSSDAKSLARNNVSAFWNEPWWNMLWQGRNLEEITSAMQERIPRHLHTDTYIRRHEKVVKSDVIVGYARWILSQPLAGEWVTAQTVSIPEQERALIEQQFAQVDWQTTNDTSILDPPVNAMMAKHRPSEPHIKLDYLAIHPGYQRLGIASKLLKSGIEQAQKLQVDIFVLATSKYSLELYKKYGFRLLEGFSQSLEPWGFAATYDTYVLVKHPQIEGERRERSESADFD